MNELLFWTIPPLAGAIIGYVTNAVAIKMLFRPLKAVRVFGIRLPFTPGILPRQRHKLADSIGAMVERELLTAEILRERLRREDVRRTAKNAVARYTARLLGAPVRDFFPSPKEREGEADAGFQGLKDHVGPGFSALWEIGLDAALAALLEELQSRDEGALGSRALGDILGENGKTALNAALEGFVNRALRASASRLPEYGLPLAEGYLPRIAASLIAFLRRPDIHGEIEIQGRVFLDNAIRKLNSIQRFFISAGQYSRTLNDKMPEIIDDLIFQLEDFLNRKDARARISALMADTLVNLLSSPEAAGTLQRMILTPVQARLEEPLEELTRMWDREKLRSALRETAARLKDRGPFLERLLNRARNVLLAERGDQSLGELLGFSAGQKEGCDAWLAEKILTAAEGEIPSVLETLNIRVMVSDRIDSLDMLRVERIILDVMAHQLKWINLFGGILGALIGMFQSVFSWLAR